jgi:hypothetical protein
LRRRAWGWALENRLPDGSCVRVLRSLRCSPGVSGGAVWSNVRG